MHTVAKYSIVGIIVLALVTGCASKPEQEIAAAKGAVDAVLADGAETYLPDDAKQLKETLDAAMEEIKIQDSKFLKNYDKAKDLLGRAKSGAESLGPTLSEAKQQAKAEAESGYSTAEAAIQEASTLVANAPRGKGSMADIEALKSDIKGLEALLPEVTDLIASEDFFAAREKASAITSQANQVSEEIRGAISKVKAARKTSSANKTGKRTRKTG